MESSGCHETFLPLLRKIVKRLSLCTVKAEMVVVVLKEAEEVVDNSYVKQKVYFSSHLIFALMIL